MTYDQVLEDELDGESQEARIIAVDALEFDDETMPSEVELMVMLSGMVGGVHEGLAP